MTEERRAFMIIAGLVGMLLTIGAGIVSKTPAAKPPTFREAFFTELDKANKVYETYSHTECTDKGFTEVETAMYNEYLTLKQLKTNIATEEKDPIQQDHEFEAYLGFVGLLKASVDEHDECTAPNPKNSTAGGNGNGSSI